MIDILFHNCNLIKFEKLKRLMFQYLFYIISPITNNIVFFINIIWLLILPSFIDTFISGNIHYDNNLLFGFKFTEGKGFPYILFLPYIWGYIICLAANLIKFASLKVYNFFHISIYIILICLFATDIFLLLNFKTMISPTIIMLIAETNGGESSDFITNYGLNFSSIIAYLIVSVAIFIILFSERNVLILSKLFVNKYSAILLLIFSMYIFQRGFRPLAKFFEIFNLNSESELLLWTTEFPSHTNSGTNFVCSMITFNMSKYEIRKGLKSALVDESYAISNNNVNLVLIIGESYSKHHSSLYNYQHETNPLLKKELKNGNLFLFDNVIASYNLTTEVMRNLFSVNSIMDKEVWNDYPAFPAIFKRAGYDVYFWDNQLTAAEGETSDYSIAAYIHNSNFAKKSYTRCNNKKFDFDYELIKSFFHEMKITNGNNLIIFHLYGQHAMAAKRYPHIKQFIKYSIDSIHGNYSDKQKEEIAQYDNATLYNDYVISQIIDHFRKKNAAILYFSDHGEEVHDFRNHYGRTQEEHKTPDILKYQYEIPFMVWCSDMYIKKHPGRIALMKAAKSKPFMNDNVSQILFGLCDMKTKYYKSERDLLNSQYKPYKHRIVQGNTDYDLIMKNSK